MCFDPDDAMVGMLHPPIRYAWQHDVFDVVFATRNNIIAAPAPPAFAPAVLALVERDDDPPPLPHPFVVRRLRLYSPDGPNSFVFVWEMLPPTDESSPIFVVIVMLLL
jgi:hypothetical protein